MRPSDLNLITIAWLARPTVIIGAALVAGGAAAETGAVALPAPSVLACVLLAVAVGAGGWFWYWLTTASFRGAGGFAVRAGAMAGAAALAMAGLAGWLGSATVVALPVLYLLVAIGFWTRRRLVGRCRPGPR
ncbi:MAG TPA: hypothetical protein VGD73_15715 [Pseudonocardia sp.]|jgi:hypothetical protein|uniref:hypothetical protein n=1 Tax=Pseudonocardia sp. TaxID=60912 RepID=UPI002ED949A0